MSIEASCNIFFIYITRNIYDAKIHKTLNLAALFSGGKDSTYAIYAAQRLGHKISCLVTIYPTSNQSHLLHFPNIAHTVLQAESMQIPHLVAKADGIDTAKETSALRNVLLSASKHYGIEGIVHGGILSNFQKNSFAKSCQNLNLKIVTPLWKMDQMQYMQQLLDSNFEFILTSVTTAGLDDTWMGRIITNQDLPTLHRLANKHGFNPSFEGGEAETFVINCPLFYRPITIKKATKIWDGYRGIFQIQEGMLGNYVR